MIPKRELTQKQIEEIQALRGRLPADEVKKRFGIGSSRLYKIWRDETADRVTQKALPSGDHITRAVDRVTAHLPPPAHGGVLPNGEIPTVKDFYNRLEGLEARVEQSTRLLMEVMAQLVHNNELEEERDKLEEEREEETCMDTAQKWAYSSIAAILIWKMVGATWKQCAPAVQEQNCRPKDQEGPLLHGVGHLDVDSCCRTDMEIGRRRGGSPHFPFELFWEHQRA